MGELLQGDTLFLLSSAAEQISPELMFKTIVIEDGRGIGRGDHFLSYRFIERTIER